jgi:hypothetical protein
LNKVVATFERHTFLSQTDLTRTASNRQKWYRHPTKENTKVRPEMTKFKMFREKVNMDFYLFKGVKPPGSSGGFRND